MYNNRPTLFINNKPVAPQFYGLTHAYGARWSWEENPSRNLKNFYSIGYRTVLGRDSATGAVMVARKEGKDHTVWFATYMFKQPQVFRAIFYASGAHI
jgi:hypothetical protein